MSLADFASLGPGLLRTGVLALLIAGWRPLAAAELSGQQIYRGKCAVCHGAQGEGSEEYDQRLEGTLSVMQLAELVGETMPADDPGSLSAEEAKLVSQYVYDSFYSAIARQKSRPVRIELARLTVDQHRLALADLIGSFRGRSEWKPGGLQADYYRGRGPGNRRDLALSRIDNEVDFDFGTAAPVDKISDPSVFSIRWEGGLLAPETGDYEFIVRTEHAARLWINDRSEPLVDAWVKSGDDEEHKASLFLVGGRVYPLRLEFSKAKQGVDDSDKKKPLEAKASIALLWTRPRGVSEPIPGRQLSSGSAAETFVSAEPFPPDDASYGWERGTSISKAWDLAATNAAIDAAGYVADAVNELAGTRDGDGQRPEKLREFCRKFVERAFRRPLGEEPLKVFVDRQFDIVDTPEEAVKRVVLLALKSPRFLYREVGGGPDQYDVAARLSFGLWDSIPDEELLRAAAEGRLATPEQVAGQAGRMLADLRARAKLRGFLLTWLKANRVTDLGKDSEAYPDFDAATIAGLRTSLELFLDDVVWSEDSDFRRLLLSDEVFVNGRLAEFYGAKTTPGEGFAKARLDDGRRAGVLTHPYVMASFAHAKETSPIHRGVFLARGVLGVFLRPPPEAKAPLAPDLHPNLTTRQRVALQTKPAECMTCHSIINPLGFTLEHFDAVGRYREKESGKPVDAAGGYQTRDGQTVSFDGARQLAAFLAGSDEVHAAFAEQLFQHLVQQPVQAYGPDTLDRLSRSFAEHEFSIRKLAVDVMAATALVGRPTELTANLKE